MDLNVTDPSLQKTSPKQRSSSFSKEPWPGMKAFNQLLDLKQGSLPIEEYVTRFYEISCKVPFDEVAFKDIFRFGLNEPIKSCLPAGRFNCSLKDFIDYALLCAGSSLTVGVSEEERNTASETKMADAPEHDRNMSATPESPAKMATKPADAPLRPGLIAFVLDAPLVSVRVAGIPRSAALSAPSQELAESAPEPAPSQELAESAPEAAPIQELAESAPEAAPIQELAEFAPEAAPIQELAEFAPEAAPIQELAESGTPGPLLVPSGSPEPLLVSSGSPEPLPAPFGSPSSPLVPSSSVPPERPRDSARPEYPLTFAPPECLPEVVDFPFVGGSYPPVLTETPDPPWPMRSPDPSWLPEAPDLPGPLKLPASVPETKYALSASCVSVSSRSQSRPGISAPPWRAPVSSAPPRRSCQSHLTSQRPTQCPFMSLLSRPPCPGGLLSHWPHMDLALRPLPRFHCPPGFCFV